MPPALRLSIAWLVIAVPLAWGVYRSIQRSLPLFSGTPASSIPTPASKPNP